MGSCHLLCHFRRRCLVVYNTRLCAQNRVFLGSLSKRLFDGSQEAGFGDGVCIG